MRTIERNIFLVEQTMEQGVEQGTGFSFHPVPRTPPSQGRRLARGVSTPRPRGTAKANARADGSLARRARPLSLRGWNEKTRPPFHPVPLETYLRPFWVVHLWVNGIAAACDNVPNLELDDLEIKPLVSLQHRPPIQRSSWSQGSSNKATPWLFGTCRHSCTPRSSSPCWHRRARRPIWWQWCPPRPPR